MSAAMAIVKELTEKHEKRIAELEASLRWYIKHVEECEGTDFLSDNHSYEVDEPHRRIVRAFRERQY